MGINIVFIVFVFLLVPLGMLQFEPDMGNVTMVVQQTLKCKMQFSVKLSVGVEPIYFELWIVWLNHSSTLVA